MARARTTPRSLLLDLIADSSLVGMIEYGVYGDLIIIYPQPHSIYLRGTVSLRCIHVYILSMILYLFMCV